MKVARKKAYRFGKSEYERIQNYKAPCKTKRFKPKMTEIDKITVRLAFTYL